MNSMESWESPLWSAVSAVVVGHGKRWCSCWHPPSFALPVCLPCGAFAPPADLLQGVGDAPLFGGADPRRVDDQRIARDLAHRHLGLRLQIRADVFFPRVGLVT